MERVLLQISAVCKQDSQNIVTNFPPVYLQAFNQQPKQVHLRAGPSWEMRDVTQEDCLLRTFR